MLGSVLTVNSLMMVMIGLSLWVRIRGKANKADIMVGVCYRPPNQDEEADREKSHDR